MSSEQTARSNAAQNEHNCCLFQEVLLRENACLHGVEDASIGVRAVDMGNLLVKLTNQLLQLKLTSCKKILRLIGVL